MSLDTLGKRTAILVPSVLLAASGFFIVNSFHQKAYRKLSLLSSVVLISAYLILSEQERQNREAEYNAQGLRYFNWLVDVPLLLYIYSKVLRIPSITLWSLLVAGALMVLLGYFSIQEHDVTLGVLSTLCFAYIAARLFLFRGRIDNGSKLYVFWLLSWSLYIIPYVIEFNAKEKNVYKGETELLFGIADVLTKVIFTYMLLVK